MSDFLTNLVMRSYSGTPSVQPMTLSTYADAAPEPMAESPEPFVEEITPAAVEPRKHVVAEKPVQETRAEPVQHTDENRSVSIAADVIVPRTQTPELEKPLAVKEKSVSPAVAETKPPRVNRRSVSEAPPKQRRVPGPTPSEQPKPSSPPAAHAEPATTPETIVHRTETKTEIQPAQLIYRTPSQTVQPSTRRLIKKPTSPIDSPAQPAPSVSRPSVPAKQETRAHKADPEIIEQVIEQVIEHSSVTIENTQHVTNSFTTLIPNTTAQRLPALSIKSRPNTPLPVLSDEAEPPAPPAETVINVAIGRIEVRATPAATSGRERQPAGPKVRTLDDYLQQRSRGAQ